MFWVGGGGGEPVAPTGGICEPVAPTWRWDVGARRGAHIDGPHANNCHDGIKGVEYGDDSDGTLGQKPGEGMDRGAGKLLVDLDLVHRCVWKDLL